jgi:hypothetical protein
MLFSQLPDYYDCDRFELSKCTDRVWINDPTGLIGRFNSTGMDVHVKGQCVTCTAKGKPDFKVFVQQMKAVHGIDLTLIKKPLPL